MTKNKMYFRMITASLVRRRSRMLVALLAIAIGATILSGLVTIYKDVPRQMQNQFRNYGANMIFVASEGNEMDMDNVNEALEDIPKDKIVGVAPYRYETIRIHEQPIIAAGTDFDGVKKTSPYWGIEGKWPKKDGTVLIGKETAELLGLAIGDKFTASYNESSDAKQNANEQSQSSNPGEGRTEDFEVVGILETGGSEEDYVFMSLADLEKLSGKSGTLDVAELSISGENEDLDRYEKTVDEDIDEITPQLVKRVTQSETKVLGKLQGLVFLVTVVVLALIMVCVATTMMAAVTERRQEIGLRKALGATNRSIMLEFMGEAMTLGIIGGLLGAGLGFGFAQVVSMNVFNSSIHIQPLLIPLTLIASIVVTALACIIPIRSATEVDPALVLKGE